ncbi:hypothetical protein J7L87_04320, partial [bacterium]|nr:hypothetical protein [bacterium]
KEKEEAKKAKEEERKRKAIEREKEAEARRRELELLRAKKEEERRAREEIRAEKKEKLLALLKQKKYQRQAEKERKILLAIVARDRKLAEKEKQKALKEAAKKAKEEVRKAALEAKKAARIEKVKAPPIKKVPPVEKELIAKKKAEKKKIDTKIASLVAVAVNLNKGVENKVKEATAEFVKFTKSFKKKPVPKEKKVPVKKPVKAPAVKYKEPFHFGQFLRKNAFRFVFFILLLVWLGELTLLISRFKSPEERLKDIVGEEIGRKPVEKKKKKVEEKKLVAYKFEKIDIEGKRDPFSTGKLTMEVMKKPSPTSIILASKPEVISIIKKPKVVSILRKERLMKAPKLSSISKPQRPSIGGISKKKLSTVEKITKPTVSPFIIPEKTCHLIYRGRMLMEGVEYLFIEGKKRTYRVTVGDIVEGYRILRKENGKIYLSKDGIIYEINAK